MFASLLLAVTAFGLATYAVRFLRAEGARMLAALGGRSIRASGGFSPATVTVRWLPRAVAAPRPLAANLNRPLAPAWRRDVA